MRNINEFLHDIINEASIDTRIVDGTIDLGNSEHVIVVAECMESRGIDNGNIEQFIEAFVGEGKYPERQAYNKDGWLVTFPSKEYRDAAIKKRTHFSSDPTHGKGGMNLYYKKKGKQKRQTQQITTTTQTVDTKKIPTSQSTASQGLSQKTKQRSPGELTPDMMGDDESTTDSKKVPTKKTVEPSRGTQQVTDKKSTTSTSSSTVEPVSKPITPSTTPAIDVPVVTTPPKQYSEVSKKFASQKRWVATPYDEYHDAEGNVVAVVGLSGEIVPVKNTDREEYKIFAEKNMPL